ncbi:hypothetical protein MW887_009125 [Aspergillus wentii]|nr:hypothetical protein MW887_009125 [Aspergillus wentii]
MIRRQFLQKQHLAVSTPRPSIGITSTRLFSTSPAPQSSDPKQKPATTKPHTIDPRWLTMMKRRVGRCMMFGLKPTQIDEAGGILQQLARDWRELVAGRHVNNVTYVRYAETARVNLTRNIGIHIDPANRKRWSNLLNSTGIGLILRSIKVDYKFPMTYPDKISVYHKLVHDPTAAPSQYAFELQVIILSEARQRPAARCHEDIVTYDYKGKKKTALPPYVMEQFKAMWELQEEAKKVWQQRIVDIENQVRTLELESWDRADAVEDTGSAKK